MTAAGDPERPLHVALLKPRRGAGGGTTMALRLAAGLRERGHRVTVYCHPRSRMRARALGDGFDVRPVLRGRSARWLIFLRTWLALRRDRPDVVFQFMAQPDDLVFGSPAALSLGLPVVVRRGLAGELELPPFERRLLAGAARVVGVSRAIGAELGRARPADAAPPDVIPNATDLERFAAAEAAQLGFPGDAVVVGFLGRLHRDKGIRELGRAWRRVAAAEPRAHLFVAGEGEHEAELREALGDAARVRLLGFRADVPELLAAADVLALPTYAEGFPNVVVEAMAAGVPVVAADVPGPDEAVVDGETGLLVPVRDDAALEAALLRLIRDPELRARMGRAARARAEAEYSEARAVDAYERVLLEAVGRR